MLLIHTNTDYKEIQWWKHTIPTTSIHFDQIMKPAFIFCYASQRLILDVLWYLDIMSRFSTWCPVIQSGILILKLGIIVLDRRLSRLQGLIKYKVQQIQNSIQCSLIGVAYSSINDSLIEKWQVPVSVSILTFYCPLFTFTC